MRRARQTRKRGAGPLRCCSQRAGAGAGSLAPLQSRRCWGRGPGRGWCAAGGVPTRARPRGRGERGRSARALGRAWGLDPGGGSARSASASRCGWSAQCAGELDPRTPEPSGDPGSIGLLLTSCRRPEEKSPAARSAPGAVGGPARAASPLVAAWRRAPAGGSGLCPSLCLDSPGAWRRQHPLRRPCRRLGAAGEKPWGVGKSQALRGIWVVVPRFQSPRVSLGNSCGSDSSQRCSGPLPRPPPNVARSLLSPIHPPLSERAGKGTGDPFCAQAHSGQAQ